MSRKGMCADAAGLVHAIGQASEVAGADPGHSEWLKSAKCGSSWLQRSSKNAKVMVPTGGFAKASGVSYKRAAAAAPELNDVMFDKIQDAYDYLYENGILKTKEPLP